MIDPAAETLLTPSEAAKHSAFRVNHKPAHVSKIYRLFDTGTKGHDGKHVKLEMLITPSGRCTSEEAIKRFYAALNGKAEGKAEPTKQRKRAVDQAEKACRDAGLM